MKAFRPYELRRRVTTVEAMDSLLVDEAHKNRRLLIALIIQLIAGATEAPVRGCDGVLTDRDVALIPPTSLTPSTTPRTLRNLPSLRLFAVR